MALSLFLSWLCVFPSPGWVPLPHAPPIPLPVSFQRARKRKCDCEASAQLSLARSEVLRQESALQLEVTERQRIAAELRRTRDELHRISHQPQPYNRPGAPVCPPPPRPAPPDPGRCLLFPIVMVLVVALLVCMRCMRSLKGLHPRKGGMIPK